MGRFCRSIDDIELPHGRPSRVSRGWYRVSSLGKASSALAQGDDTHPDGARPHSLKTSLGFLLNRAGVAVGNAFSQELKQAGMTLAMWRVLAALHDTGHQSLGELAEFISVEISTLSRQVATLTGRGLVESRPGKDWRSVDLSLTPRGDEVVLCLLPAVQRHEAAAFNDIHPGDVEALKALLAKITDNLCALDKIEPIGVDASH